MHRTTRESRHGRRLPPARAQCEQPGPWSFLEQPLGEHDLHDPRSRLLARPIALQLGPERNPIDGPATSLDDTLETGAMRLERGTADRIDDGIHLVTLPQRVERG